MMSKKTINIYGKFARFGALTLRLRELLFRHIIHELAPFSELSCHELERIRS